jgi:hypothetical protein
MLVTVTSHAGISNRIKNIMSALSQYDNVGTLHEPINYIFPSVKMLNELNNPYEENWRLYVSKEEQQYTKTYKTIDLLYEETPEYFIKKYLDVIRKLEINKDIIDYVDEFTKEWDNMVGVHIRSWYCEKNLLHSNGIFEEQIDKLNPEKFFFCSDNSDVQKYFLKKYKDRIVTYERQMFNDPHLAESGHHDNLQITTDAFIELLILSKCATIIGTYASSFDEVAWWFSGCKSKIIIPTPINHAEYKKWNDLIYLKK